MRSSFRLCLIVRHSVNNRHAVGAAHRHHEAFLRCVRAMESSVEFLGLNCLRRALTPNGRITTNRRLVTATGVEQPIETFDFNYWGILRVYFQ